VRVLFVTTRLPHPPHRGDQVRAYHHLLWLAPRHEITCCVVGGRSSPDSVAAVAALGVRVESITNGAVRRVAAMGRGLIDRRPFQTLPAAGSRQRAGVEGLARDADVIHAQLVRTGPLVLDLGAPVVFDLVDALSMNLARRSMHDRGLRRWASAREARRLAGYERTLVASAAGVAVSTPADATALGNGPITVVPNGVDLEAFAYRSHPRSEPVVVFAGNLGYFPNVDAAMSLVREVMPGLMTRVPGARLILAGARPAAAVRRLTGPGVSLVADPEDMASIVGSAAVTIVPMRAGTGIQNKVLEAMAAGTPVVTTRRVADAVGGVDGEHLLVAEEAQGMIEAAAAVVSDPALAERLAGAARRLVEEHHRWEDSAAAIEALWERAVAK
jgi:glycosyltransferase involved in cell wall biosynthesis